ncbi:MAG: hypothetical protein AAF727_13075 [Pseudomonadota bacterium]
MAILFLVSGAAAVGHASGGSFWGAAVGRAEAGIVCAKSACALCAFCDQVGRLI